MRPTQNPHARRPHSDNGGPSSMTVLTQGAHLLLPRCPHCGLARPTLTNREVFTTVGPTDGERSWYFYICSHCGGVVMALSRGKTREVAQIWPTLGRSAETLPARAKEYLDQARETLAQSSASIVMSAAAIDSMLKSRGLRDGSLYERIDQAAANHLITSDMAQWAHQVRLDANDQRHADESMPLPRTEDARRCLDFAEALGDVLFVLPARVTRGRAEAAMGS